MTDPTPSDERDTRDTRDFLRSVRKLIDRALALPSQESESISSLELRVSEHLGANVRELPVVSESFAPHRIVDLDVALAAMADPGDEAIGITGGQQRYHSNFIELIANPYRQFDIGPVDLESHASGPDSERQVVAFGFRLLRVDGVPVAVLQRAPKQGFGQNDLVIEVIAPTRDGSALALARVRQLMTERSVLRGQVLSFANTEYGQAAGATFLHRPEVARDGVILPTGVLERVARHVIGISDERDRIRAAGQHLKRGVLLYGPPGTGKTLTVRHLLSETRDATAVLLTGSSLRFIGAAAEIARTFQPSIVVLEDVDLVAFERGSHGAPQPLLFEVLDALDGLDGDADIAFIMTTNRVDVLERALVERPGRVDLAVEIPLPDHEARRRMFRRYAGQLPFSDDAIDAAAARAEGTTGSFAKELMRRAVLLSAERSQEPADADLAAALDALLGASETLTRRLLGDGAVDNTDG